MEPRMDAEVPSNGASDRCEETLEGVSLLTTSGLPQDGHDGGTVVLHVFVEGLPMRKTLGLTASADQHQIQMLPHMIEAHVRVIV